MPTPTTPEKRLLAAGAVKGSIWNTAVAVGALNGALIVSDGGLKLSRPYMPLPEADTPFPQTGIQGAYEPVDFAPEFFMRYDPTAIGLLLALFAGTAGAPVLQDTTAYLHTLQMKDSIYGNFVTFVAERAGEIFEVPSAKPHGFTFNFENGGLKGVVNMRGDIVKDDSVTNTATQVDALTYRDRQNPCLATECTVKMNDESAGAVSAETKLDVGDISIELMRILGGSDPVAGQDTILEPLEDGQPVAKISLSFDRMSAINAAYFADFKDKTSKKASIVFTGALIEATYYYGFNLHFPRLIITNVEYANSGEIIPATIDLIAEEAAAAPTGMTYARYYMELLNLLATDYLA